MLIADFGLLIEEPVAREHFTMARLLSFDESRVAIPWHLVNELEIMLPLAHRIVRSDIDLHEKAARRSPIMFDRARLKACFGQLADEPLGTFSIRK